jgi:hypothetical protein
MDLNYEEAIVKWPSFALLDSSPAMSTITFRLRVQYCGRAVLYVTVVSLVPPSAPGRSRLATTAPPTPI